MRSLLTYPLTWVAIATVIGLEWAFWQWFEPGLVAGALTAAMAAGLLALWAGLLVRSEAFAAHAFRVPDDVRQQQTEKLAQLEADLAKVDSKQGLDQLRILGQKIVSLTEVLERRMNAGELTFGRYLRTAEQVYYSTLDNLHEVAVTLTSVEGIDRGYIESRLAELHEHGPSEAPPGTVENLEQRRALLEQQLAKVSQLLAQNETAMTVLDNTTAVLADTRMGRGHASMDAEAAMAALEELARRTGEYSASRDS